MKAINEDFNFSKTFELLNKEVNTFKDENVDKVVNMYGKKDSECFMLDSMRVGKFLVLPYIDINVLHKSIPLSKINSDSVMGRGDMCANQINLIRTKCMSTVSQLKEERLNSLTKNNPTWDKQMFEGDTSDMVMIKTFVVNKIKLRVYFRCTLNIISLFVSTVEDVIIPTQRVVAGNKRKEINLVVNNSKSKDTARELVLN